MIDYGQLAQLAAENRVERLNELLDAEQNYDEAVAWPDDLTAPYCGCNTCIVRETLTAAWPLLVEAVKAGAE